MFAQWHLFLQLTLCPPIVAGLQLPLALTRPVVRNDGSCSLATSDGYHHVGYPCPELLDWAFSLSFLIYFLIWFMGVGFHCCHINCTINYNPGVGVSVLLLLKKKCKKEWPGQHWSSLGLLQIYEEKYHHFHYFVGIKPLFFKTKALYMCFWSLYWGKLYPQPGLGGRDFSAWFNYVWQNVLCDISPQRTWKIHIHILFTLPLSWEN